MKKFLFVSGTRADFGKIKPLLKYVEKSGLYELHLLVTGMHMMKLYGSTYLEVKKEGFNNIYCIANQHSDEPMCSTLGNTISLISRLVHEVEPDIIVVHGDRLEALAGATVGALSNRLVCHIEGGELSGTVDDLIRHAISKLAHIHMVANEEAKNRLLQMGELEDSVYIIGSPDLDVMHSSELPTIEEVRSKYQIHFDDYAVSMFHPVTTEEEFMLGYAENYFKALSESGGNFVVIYPNNDAGSQSILNVIRKYDGNPRFKIFPSVRFEYFLALLKSARYMIGNSSAGVREAPFYGVPSINVGTRQNRRFKSDSIIDSTYQACDIIRAIARAKRIGRFEPSNWFGTGNSVSSFAEALKAAAFWETPVQKSFVDM